MPMYKRPDDIDDEDIVEVDNETVDNEEPTSPEEATWKKRYGDLRRHSSTLQGQINRLKEQLQSQVVMPSNDDEEAINEWMQKYPQVARIVQGIATREAEKRAEQLQSRIEEINTREAQVKKEYAQNKLAELHPDFFDVIRHQPEFHDWLGSRSQAMQDAIYGEDYDWKAAADVVDMYKVFVEKNDKKPAKTQKKTENAAREVPRRGSSPTPAPDRGGHLFSESQINAMSAAEYEKFEEDIERAWVEGKVLRDLTGGAR